MTEYLEIISYSTISVIDSRIRNHFLKDQIIELIEIHELCLRVNTQ